MKCSCMKERGVENLKARRYNGKFLPESSHEASMSWMTVVRMIIKWRPKLWGENLSFISDIFIYLLYLYLYISDIFQIYPYFLNIFISSKIVYRTSTWGYGILCASLFPLLPVKRWYMSSLLSKVSQRSWKGPRVTRIRAL